jgi:uroporphyrinogen III methyltransferase/synthase
VQKLIEADKSKDTPVALIRWGTRSSQKTLVGKLSNIVKKVEKAKFKPPAIIVVGDVVKLRNKTNWVEKKPLFGKNIIVTRPVEQADSLCRVLRRDGSNPIRISSIKFISPDDYKWLDERIEVLKDYNWCIFSSVNGVKYFMNRLYNIGYDARAFGSVRLCAIGTKTAAELRKHGLVVDYIPKEYVSEAIIKGFLDYNLEGEKFLLPGANIARQKLKVGLEEQGAEVDNITVYQTVKAVNNNSYKQLTKNRMDMVTFTSSSTVNKFIEGLKDSKIDMNEFMNSTNIACIGPITASSVEEHGFKVDVVAEEYTMEGLFQAIKKYYKNNQL